MTGRGFSGSYVQLFADAARCGDSCHHYNHWRCCAEVLGGWIHCSRQEIVPVENCHPHISVSVQVKRRNALISEIQRLAGDL